MREASNDSPVPQGVPLLRAQRRAFSLALQKLRGDILHTHTHKQTALYAGQPLLALQVDRNVLSLSAPSTSRSLVASLVAHRPVLVSQPHAPFGAEAGPFAARLRKALLPRESCRAAALSCRTREVFGAQVPLSPFLPRFSRPHSSPPPPLPGSAPAAANDRTKAH